MEQLTRFEIQWYTFKLSAFIGKYIHSDKCNLKIDRKTELEIEKFLKKPQEYANVFENYKKLLEIFKIYLDTLETPDYMKFKVYLDEWLDSWRE